MLTKYAGFGVPTQFYHCIHTVLVSDAASRSRVVCPPTALGVLLILVIIRLDNNAASMIKEVL